MAETVLTEVQHKVPTCPGKHLFVIRERLYAHPVHSYFVWQLLFVTFHCYSVARLGDMAEWATLYDK